MTPIVNTYLIEFIKANFTTLALCYGLTSVVGMCFAKQWGKLIDLAGSKPMIRLGLFVVGAVLPISLVAATPEVSWPIYLAAALESLVLGIVTPALFKLAIRSYAPVNISIRIAYFSVVMGIASTLGAFLSGVMFNLLKPMHFMLLGIDFNGYRLCFLSIGILILMSIPMFWFSNPPNQLIRCVVDTKHSFALLNVNKMVSSFRRTIKFVVLSILKRAG